MGWNRQWVEMKFHAKITTQYAGDKKVKLQFLYFNSYIYC